MKANPLPPQECEVMLAAKSQQGNEMVSQLVKTLGSALVYADVGNFETNRKLWDNYAAEWGPNISWVQTMARGSRADRLDIVGDEWSTREEVARVVQEFVLPYVGVESEVAEIGCGGGRVTTQVFGHVGNITCFDISRNMLKRARAAVDEAGGHGQAKFVLLENPQLPARLGRSFDFVILFDVLVHVDLHTTNTYMREVARVLKPGGKAFVSTANLLSPGGWERFQMQSKYSVGGFYFICPAMVQKLVAEAGLKIVKEAPFDPTNIYYYRDYLIILEKP
ncbi:unnamed protein product [Discosporangium mesarthrocarpum]